MIGSTKILPQRKNPIDNLAFPLFQRLGHMAPPPDRPILSGLGASFATTSWQGIRLDAPYYQLCLPFQLTLRPVVFFDSNQILWQRSQDSIPANGETSRVLRPLWTELSAETIRLHPLQTCSHALLVPANEPGHAARGCYGQWPRSDVRAPALCHGTQRTFPVSGLVVAGPKSRSLRLGHFRRGLASLGLLRVERGPPQNQRLVYPQAPDSFARRRCCSHDSLVDSRRPTSGPIPLDDWQVSRLASDSCLGSGTRRFRTSVHRRRIARLSPRPRPNPKRCQHRDAIAGAHHDGCRMVADLLRRLAFQTVSPEPWISSEIHKNPRPSGSLRGPRHGQE